MKWTKIRSFIILAITATLLTTCQDDEVITTESQPTENNLTKELSAICNPVYGRGLGVGSKWYRFDPRYKTRKGWRRGSYKLQQRIKIMNSARSHFWAIQFWFHNGDGGYMGLQDGAYINGRKQKVAIFSIWKALGASGVPGGIAQPFSGEGEGYQVLAPFNWQNGVEYEMYLHQYWDESTYPFNEWWGVWVKWNNGRSSKYVGRIKVPGNWNWLQPATGGFVENWEYSNLKSCNEIPFTYSVFYKPKMDNRWASYIKGESYSVQPQGCPTNLCDYTVRVINSRNYVRAWTGLDR